MSTFARFTAKASRPRPPGYVDCDAPANAAATAATVAASETMINPLRMVMRLLAVVLTAPASVEAVAAWSTPGGRRVIGRRGRMVGTVGTGPIPTASEPGRRHDTRGPRAVRGSRPSERLVQRSRSRRDWLRRARTRRRRAPLAAQGAPGRAAPDPRRRPGVESRQPRSRRAFRRPERSRAR